VHAACGTDSDHSQLGYFLDGLLFAVELGWFGPLQKVEGQADAWAGAGIERRGDGRAGAKTTSTRRAATRGATTAPVAQSTERREVQREAMSKTISIGGKSYTWAELAKPEVRRAILPPVEAMIAAYKRNPEPWQAEGWSELDVKTAIRWTTGAFDGLPEETMRAYTDEVVTAYNEKIVEFGGEPIVATALTDTQQPAVDGKSAYKELAALMKQPEVIVALQKRRTGQALDARQVAILDHHDALDTANRGQAMIEKAAKVTRPPRASIDAPTVTPKFKDVDEARAKRLELQHDLGSDYHNPASVGYKQARETVKAAYQLETGEAETK
jgi:hypothetical protein